jgi:hypothetical protein
MPCDPLPGGGFVCSRGPRWKKCSVPGCTERGTQLCDWKLKGSSAGRTCDAAICVRHATKPAPDKDLCPAHARAWQEWKEART